LPRNALSLSSVAVIASSSVHRGSTLNRSGVNRR
jgi:hypothetical protein